jgi:hypothetical protein
VSDVHRDEFYVGYLPVSPPRIGARTRRVALGLLVATAGIALLVVGAMSPPGPGTFEFGVVRTVEGTVHAGPPARLEVPRPGVAGGTSVYLLSVFGKRGAQEVAAPHDGRPVRVEGSLIHRDGRTMVEVASMVPIEGTPRPAREEALGSRTLVGEIVDSKCFLGVMKPGNLKPHRACATRCISGGIPPVLVVRDVEGVAEYYALVGPDGRAVNRDVLHLIAEPVEITGEVRRIGDLLVLAADPSAIHRLGHDPRGEEAR